MEKDDASCVQASRNLQSFQMGDLETSLDRFGYVMRLYMLSFTEPLPSDRKLLFLYTSVVLNTPRSTTKELTFFFIFCKHFSGETLGKCCILTIWFCSFYHLPRENIVLWMKIFSLLIFFLIFQVFSLFFCAHFLLLLFSNLVIWQSCIKKYVKKKDSFQFFFSLYQYSSWHL